MKKRKPTNQDLYLLQQMFRNPDFIGVYGVTLSDEKIKLLLQKDIQHWSKYGFGCWLFFEDKTNKFIGRGGLNTTIIDGKSEVELAYALQPEFWGRGLATEIGQIAIAYAQTQLTLSNLVCFTLTSNQQSQKVMKKLGFEHEKNIIHKDLPHVLSRIQL